MVDNSAVVLLVKLAVAASLASIMARFTAFQRILMREQRTLHQRLKLALGFSGIFAAGVGTRLLLKSYLAVDLGLEGSLIAGAVGGYISGLVSGALISLPAMFAGEYLSMPLFVGVGALGGFLRDCAVDPEEVWRFSPLLDFRWSRLFRGSLDYRRTIYQMLFMLAIFFSEFLRFSLSGFLKGKAVFSLHPAWNDPQPFNRVAVYVATLFCITVPLKIWNNMRNEQKLEAQNGF